MLIEQKQEKAFLGKKVKAKKVTLLKLIKGSEVIKAMDLMMRHKMAMQYEQIEGGENFISMVKYSKSSDVCALGKILKYMQIPDKITKNMLLMDPEKRVSLSSVMSQLIIEIKKIPDINLDPEVAKAIKEAQQCISASIGPIPQIQSKGLVYLERMLATLEQLTIEVSTIRTLDSPEMLEVTCEDDNILGPVIEVLEQLKDHLIWKLIEKIIAIPILEFASTMRSHCKIMTHSSMNS